MWRNRGVRGVLSTEARYCFPGAALPSLFTLPLRSSSDVPATENSRIGQCRSTWISVMPCLIFGTLSAAPHDTATRRLMALSPCLIGATIVLEKASESSDTWRRRLDSSVDRHSSLNIKRSKLQLPLLVRPHIRNRRTLHQRNEYTVNGACYGGVESRG